jgi:hypothetical protein
MTGLNIIGSRLDCTVYYRITFTGEIILLYTYMGFKRTDPWARLPLVSRINVFVKYWMSRSEWLGLIVKKIDKQVLDYKLLAI